MDTLRPDSARCSSVLVDAAPIGRGHPPATVNN